MIHRRIPTVLWQIFFRSKLSSIRMKQCLRTMDRNQGNIEVESFMHIGVAFQGAWEFNDISLASCTLLIIPVHHHFNPASSIGCLTNPPYHVFLENSVTSGSPARHSVYKFNVFSHSECIFVRKVSIGFLPMSH